MVLKKSAIRDILTIMNSESKIFKANYDQAGCFRKSGDIESAILAYQEALKIKPNSPVIYRDLAILYEKVGNLDEAINSHKKAISLNSKSLKWHHKKIIEIIDKKKNNDVYESIWNSIHQSNFEWVKHESFDYPKEFSRQSAKAIKDYFIQTDKFKVVNFQSLLSKQDQDLLNENHISLTFLNYFKQGFQLAQEKNINSFKFNFKTRVMLETEQVGFHQSMIETGYFQIICPTSGKLLTSNHSFFLNHSIGIYRFSGETHVFYVICAGKLFQPSLVYFPKLEIIIQINRNLLNETTPTNLVNQIKVLFVANWYKLVSNLNSRKKKETVIILSYAPNMLHFLRDGLSGIQAIQDNKILNKIDRIIINPSNQYYGEISKIFPHFSKNKIDICPSSDISKISLENDYFILRPSGTFIQEKLAARIYQYSLRQCNSSFLNYIKDARKCFPLVLIGIRSSTSRTWVSQVEGVANILRSISSRFPKLGVVFDGVSRVEYDACMSIREQEAIEKDREVVKETVALLSDCRINFYDTVGCMMYESIVWSKAVDMYIAPFGAGLTKVYLIANKPGIIHTNHQILKRPLAFRAYSYERENGVVPSYIPVERVTSVSDEKNSQLNRQNYDCDWQWIYQEAMRIISELNSKKS